MPCLGNSADRVVAEPIGAGCVTPVLVAEAFQAVVETKRQGLQRVVAMAFPVGRKQVVIAQSVAQDPRVASMSPNRLIGKQGRGRIEPSAGRLC
ncbi:hypothetical protein D3C80_1372850 [compost metagenome]